MARNRHSHFTKENAGEMQSKGIRSRKLKALERQKIARRMWDNGTPIETIAETLGVKRVMAYRLIGGVKKKRERKISS